MIGRLIQTMEERKLLYQKSFTSEDVKDTILKKNTSIYCGFDPTAPSLHLGHLSLIRVLVLAAKCGIRPIVLWGGGTAMVGDPTGRRELRPMLSFEEIQNYKKNFEKLITRYFPQEEGIPPVLFLDNEDWLLKLSMMDFARDVAKHFTVAKLLSADANKTRYQEGGLTVFEMCYQILQSYDFFYLNKYHDCLLQVGGSDQWSNILGGVDLIRRKSQESAFGLTVPLLTRSDGQKIGKTQGNAIWLDPSMTSPYDFFQYLRNLPDVDIPQMCLYFLDENVSDLQERILREPINELKKHFAYEMTKWVHGEEEAQKALDSAQTLFGKHSHWQDQEGIPKIEIEVSKLPQGILDIIVHAGFVSSKTEAKKLILGKGLTLGEKICEDIQHQIQIQDFENDQLLLRKGKKDYKILRLNHDK
jgi:tyrosyl-tRNA synthetase